MKLVIKDDEILATHTDEHDISLTLYPGATEIKTVRDDLDVYKSVTVADIETKVFKTLTELGLSAEDEKVVRIIDGGKISEATLTALNAATTVEELRTILSTILTGTP